MPMPDNYFSRYDAADNYDQHLFISGRGLQSAELNEIQQRSANMLRSVADSLFADGDIVRDARCTVDEDSGAVSCESGAIYLRGMVRGVPPRNFTIPVIGTFSVGVYLVDSVVTALEDPGLRDPAAGTRNYNEPGAERLLVTPTWGRSGDGSLGEFYPVYEVVDGVLSAKDAPPNLDSLNQALARYDRDSTGGTYVVSGMGVTMMDDAAGKQVYSIAEGRARVNGYGIEFPTSRRLRFAADPSLRLISNEPTLSASASAQRINVDYPPLKNITQVSITVEKTEMIVHGVYTGAADILPDSSILELVEVKQGGTTYVPTTDFLLTGGSVDWSPVGNEPAPGSTYQVTYRHITNVTPTGVDETGFSVTGAVVGTLVLATYNQMLPRWDRICVDSSGFVVVVSGVSSSHSPVLPAVPNDVLVLADIYQSWTASRKMHNASIRMVSMPILASIDTRIDRLLQLVAQQRLESNIHTREAGTKKGLFTDPFLDDSQRDAGIPQTAAIIDGLLMLPIIVDVSYVDADITSPQTLAGNTTPVLYQPLSTGSMKINPYMAFGIPNASVELSPSVDRWTVVQDSLSEPTRRIIPSRWTESRTVSEDVLSVTTTPLETLRPIDVEFVISGLGGGDTLDEVIFDGIDVTPVGVVANLQGVATGSFSIPSGIPSGDKLVSILSSSGVNGSATFSGQGTAVRRTINRTEWVSPPRPTPVRGIDPLAQTFSLPDSRQVSSIDIWFDALPTTNVIVQVRETSVGIPTSVVIAEVTKAPADVVLGGAHTRFEFTPVYLLADREYAFVVLCNDPVGSVLIAEMGRYDQAALRWVTSQPYTVGVLLSSSNASTWTAHQDRDMKFRINSKTYTENERTIPIGKVPVVGATDLLLMAYADQPHSDSRCEYTLGLPGGEVVRIADGEPVNLASAITGDVNVSAVLHGDAVSPVFHPGTQLVHGILQNTADYISRAMPAGTNVTVKVIFEAEVPSGSSIDVLMSGIDGGDTFVTVPLTASNPMDQPFVEFIHALPAVTETAVRVKLVLHGTPAARPVVRDLRVYVL